MNAELLVLGWDKFLKDSVSLARQIRKSGYQPGVLIAIARGGWILGRLLSDFLRVREVASLTIRSYKGIEIRFAESGVHQQALPDLRGRRVLVVDDIADTGATLRTAVEIVKKAGAEDTRTAALYMKTRSSFTPDYFIQVVDKWVVFPYEYYETVSELLDNGVKPADLLRMGFGEELLDDLLHEVGVDK